LIQVNHISKQYGGKSILQDVTFSLSQGEKISIVGPGGCGKTLLLKILLGLIAPDTGSTSILGVDMNTALSKDQMGVRKQIGMAFQQGGLFDFMTVRENLLFAIEHMTAMSPKMAQATIDDLLAAVKLPHVQSMFPYELSGGMQRRVGIARALCTHPQVAFFDEPTAGLDPVTSTIILNMILTLGISKKEKTPPSMIVVTSNVETAIRFAERILVLQEGRVAADGPWRELLVTGPPWVQHFLQVRFIGLDLEYAKELDLPDAFLRKHW
jgi:phospholipid/cholesterol/gamma-HCH transport system ATP-binding protein